MYHSNVLAPLYSITTSFKRTLPLSDKNYDRTLTLLVLLAQSYDSLRDDIRARIEKNLAMRNGILTVSLAYFLWFFEEVLLVVIDADDICRGNNLSEFRRVLPRLIRVLMVVGRRHYTLGFSR